MKRPPLEVFINTGFDMEFFSINGQVKAELKTVLDHDPTINFPNMKDNNPHLRHVYTPSKTIGGHNRFYKCRPSLNKPQVLDDYSFIKSLEGFVWEYTTINSSGELYVTNKPVSSINVLNDEDFWRIQWLKFVGVMKGSIYEQWAIENDIPVRRYK